MADKSDTLHFSQFLSRDRIICGLRASDRDACIRELTDLLVSSVEGLDAEETFRAVLERENQLSTAIAPGLAVPHARLGALSEVLVAIGTSAEGVDFRSAERGAAHVVVLVLSPRSDPGAYLQMLSALARSFVDETAPASLAALNSPEEVWQFFHGKQDALPEFVTARDIMRTDLPALREADTLQAAINLLGSSQLLDVPVIDAEGDLVGMVSAEDLLRFALPEHLLWMEDLSPIMQLEPFAEMLRKETDTKVADVMSDTYVVVPEDAPVIQVAKMMMRRDVRMMMVTRGRRLLGVIKLEDFVTELFWA